MFIKSVIILTVVPFFYSKPIAESPEDIFNSADNYKYSTVHTVQCTVHIKVL